MYNMYKNVFKKLIHGPLFKGFLPSLYIKSPKDIAKDQAAGVTGPRCDAGETGPSSRCNVT